MIGDGVVCVDSEIIQYGQDNLPDYLGYHLTEDFNYWYAKLNQRISLNNSVDVSISTDGILTFNYIGDKPNHQSIDVVDFLLNDKVYAKNDTMLTRKLPVLEREYGLKPADDVEIIRMFI